MVKKRVMVSVVSVVVTLRLISARIDCPNFSGSRCVANVLCCQCSTG
jgi:hypothetical protein